MIFLIIFFRSIIYILLFYLFVILFSHSASFICPRPPHFLSASYAPEFYHVISLCVGIVTIFEIWSEKQTLNPLEFEVDLWRNSSIKFHIFYSWISMIEILMLFLTKILSEFYDINLDDVWYIYLKDCRFKIQHEFYKGNN